MSTDMTKAVGIACISMLLQVGASSQDLAANVTKAEEVRTTESSKSLSLNSLSNKNALTQLDIASDPATNKDKAKAEAKAESAESELVASPRVGIKNPELDLRFRFNDSELHSNAFSIPSLEVLGEPKNFKATAYALPGRTRTGAYVRRGVIAADPRVIPLGSVVQLKAGKYTGVYTVHDTGGKIKGNIVDVWVPSNQEARQFGRRNVKLHILRFGPKGGTEKRK